MRGSTCRFLQDAQHLPEEVHIEARSNEQASAVGEDDLEGSRSGVSGIDLDLEKSRDGVGWRGGPWWGGTAGGGATFVAHLLIAMGDLPTPGVEAGFAESVRGTEVTAGQTALLPLRKYVSPKLFFCRITAFGLRHG
jgi:hypothetical protein